MQPRNVVLIATALLMVVAAGCAPTPAAPAAAPTATEQPAAMATDEGGPAPTTTIDYANELEDFDPDNFSNPTDINNQWFPMQPGTQWSYEGVTEDAGETIPHRVVITITDLTKEIAGVQSVVAWDQDFSAGELVETELAFFAQDDSGNVWRLGEYPEVYEEGKMVEAPAWITGLKGAQAGIIMEADPQVENPSYSQGWAPAVDFTDRGQVAEVGQQNCVPLDCYEDVLVIEEFSQSEPDAFQLKYYAPGVGNIRVGWKGEDASREVLELIEMIQLSPEEMEAVRDQALELEQRAYEISKEVYDQTSPAELPTSGSE